MVVRIKPVFRGTSSRAPAGAGFFIQEGMKIVVNGETMDVPDDASVSSMLETLELSKDRVAVELNRAIVDREAFGFSLLKEGDRVEIIRFVGGGDGRG